MDNPLRFIDPDGMGPGPFDFPNPFAGLKTMWNEGVMAVKNFVKEAAMYTDLDDITVLGSAVASAFTGKDPVHINGTVASSNDVENAKNGLLMPVVSGGAVSKVEKAIAPIGDAGGTEIVQRAMTKSELKATENSGLLRGGREGTHYVSNNVNNTAKDAQKRLALPNKPEVKVTMEVPAGRFSPESKVPPTLTQPGGGMERTATGDIPVVIKNVKEYKK